FARADANNKMKEWQPPKTPPKNARRWNHAEQEHEHEQDQLPFELSHDNAPAPDESRDECRWSNQATGQFGRAVRHQTRREISPVHCPRGENESRKRGWRKQPLPMCRYWLQFTRRTVNQIENCQPGGRRQPEPERDTEKHREN